MLKLTKFLVAAAGWLVLSLSPVWAQDAGSMKISISRDGTVKEVLDDLCDAIDGSLLVRSTDVDLSRKVSVHMEGATVNELLSRIFDGSDIKWTISGKQIQVYRPQAHNQQPPLSGGNRTVSGIILDESGQAVIGAAIMLEGTREEQPEKA